MLDVPAYALLVGASLCFLRWLDAERRTSPYGCAALLVAAIYTKYNTGFILVFSSDQLPTAALGLRALDANLCPLL